MIQRTLEARKAATGRSVEGSGSGELQHAKGRGEFLADPSGSIVLDLEVA